MLPLKLSNELYAITNDTRKQRYTDMTHGGPARFEMTRLAFKTCVVTGLAALLACMPLAADSKKLTEDQRIELLRGLSAEFATIKTLLPISKRVLEFHTDGTWDKTLWKAAEKEFGPAGRVGDLIQVTHVQIDKDRILLELNNGSKAHWYNHIEGGMGNSTQPIDPATTAPGGTTVALLFDAPIGQVTSAEVKMLLKPILDFEKETATESHIESLPEPVKEAIRKNKVIEGMNRDQVLMSVGRPIRKSRETKDGKEIEDWIYGEPPGRVSFVTFSGDKVIRVKETYAGLGGSVAETAPVQ